jgi:hypothetical protein
MGDFSGKPIDVQRIYLNLGNKPPFLGQINGGRLAKNQNSLGKGKDQTGGSGKPQRADPRKGKGFHLMSARNRTDYGR